MSLPIQSAGCVKCVDWGTTVTSAGNPCPIACSDCGRLTWPNLGVNCHAGMAWAFSGSRGMMITRIVERERESKSNMAYWRGRLKGRWRGVY